MIDSSMYGLSNPWMTEDIGYACIDKQLPMAPGSLGGIYPGGTTLAGVKLQGPLSNDVVVISQKEKDKNIWKGIAAVAGLVAVAILGLKSGKNIVKKCWSGIKNLFSKIKPHKP